MTQPNLRAGVTLPAHPKIAIVRALEGLGDLLCTIPALRALREAIPDAVVTLVGLAEARTFAARFPRYIDKLVYFPGFPGIPEGGADLRVITEFLEDMHERRFDLALQMHGSGQVSNVFTAMLGATRNAGFYLPGLFCPDGELFLAYPEHLPEPRRHLALIEFLGIPVTDEQLEWPVSDDDRRELAEVEELAGLVPQGYACIHPGAREPLRRWDARGFAEVADRVAERGLTVVLTGTAGESDIVAETSTRMSAEHLDASGRTTVGSYAALLEGARLLVTNDTGPSHIAAALEIPSVVVFTGSERTRWAPLDAGLHRAVGQGMIERHPCNTHIRRDELCLRDGCTLPSRHGNKSFDEPPVAAVMAEVDELLSKESIRVG